MKCSKCKTTEGKLVITTRYKLKSGEEKISFYCNSCNTKRCREYRNEKGGMKNVYKAAQKYTKQNPEKRRAWELARDIPLEPCEKCGSTNYIHKHHDDYSKPLKVKFLCPSHHKERHRLLQKRQD